MRGLSRNLEMLMADSSCFPTLGSKDWPIGCSAFEGQVTAAPLGYMLTTPGKGSTVNIQ
jgi:hypothetical protein